MTYCYKDRKLGDDALDAIRQLSAEEQREIGADYMRTVWGFYGNQRFELDPLLREVMKHLKDAGSAGLDVSFGGLCWKDDGVPESGMKRLTGDQIAHVIGAKAGPMVRIYDDAVVVEIQLNGETCYYMAYFQKNNGKILRQMLDPDRYGRLSNVVASLDEGSPVGKLRDGQGRVIGTTGSALMEAEKAAEMLESGKIVVFDPYIIHTNKSGKRRKAPARAMPEGC